MGPTNGNNQRKKKISRNLKNLYLDPNNYRFVDDDNYAKIKDKDITNASIQNRTRSFIEGKKRENIKDLISSFKTNGFLEVDMIQVRDLGDNSFLVLEGNRRIAALKALQSDNDDDLPIGNLDPQIFKSIPFKIYANGNNEKHLVIMGLKHISGNKKWAAINQAQLIYDYLKPYWTKNVYSRKETELYESLGISLIKLRQTQKAYHLILAYKRSDYGDQFESDMFSLFVETIKRPNIKNWLKWNDQYYKAENLTNQERLFSWISKTTNIDDSYGDDEVGEELEEREPIISKAHEIRDLAQFIGNEKAILIMEEKSSVARGLVASGIQGKQEYERSIFDLKNNIKVINRYKDLIPEEILEELKESHKSFDEIFPKKTNIDISSGNYSVCFEYGNVKQFDDLYIKSYNIFNNFKLQKLNRINIFAGLNNSGKTSLLEAIYLLSKQNDIASFFEVTKNRNKLDALNPVWLNKSFDEPVLISGTFNSINTSINITKFEAHDIDKKDDYITSYQIEASLADRDLTSVVHTYGYGPLSRKYEKIEHLCRSIYKSPYFYKRDEILTTHNSCLETKIQGKTVLTIVEGFIAQIDSSINSINLSEVDNIKRFLVDSEKFKDKNLDITNYGEGLQRIFEIALAFAYTQNGIICIDEFETAIHKSLLINFTAFVQKLAVTFNVQVFLSSHSKECIDAFVNNNFNNSDISGFLLNNHEGKVVTKYIAGARLKSLVDNIDIDIRGGEIG